MVLGIWVHSVENLLTASWSENDIENPSAIRFILEGPKNTNCKLTSIEINFFFTETKDLFLIKRSAFLAAELKAKISLLPHLQLFLARHPTLIIIWKNMMKEQSRDCPQSWAFIIYQSIKHKQFLYSEQGTIINTKLNRIQILAELEQGRNVGFFSFLNNFLKWNLKWSHKQFYYEKNLINISSSLTKKKSKEKCFKIDSHGQSVPQQPKSSLIIPVLFRNYIFFDRLTKEAVFDRSLIINLL